MGQGGERMKQGPKRDRSHEHLRSPKEKRDRELAAVTRRAEAAENRCTALEATLRTVNKLASHYVAKPEPNRTLARSYTTNK
jgi:hypothetical protein